MNKMEADTVLLACKKHGISLTMRKEGSIYFVIFINRFEITNFEGAKLITNGLVLEGRHKIEVKKNIYNTEDNTIPKFSNYSKRKNRDDVVSFEERRRKTEN